MQAEFQRCGSQQHRVIGGGFVWSWMNIPQSQSPSLGNKYLVAMATFKVDEGWINQNTVNPFYELPKKSSVKWTLWSVSSYSYPITEQLHPGCYSNTRCGNEFYAHTWSCLRYHHTNTRRPKHVSKNSIENARGKNVYYAGYNNNNNDKTVCNNL